MKFSGLLLVPAILQISNFCQFLSEKTSLTLFTNYKIINEKAIEMERNMHRMEQYSRWECIEIVGILISITNNLLEEHVLLFFEVGVVFFEAWCGIGDMDIVARHRLGKTNSVIVKLLNRKDSQYILEKNHYITVWLHYIITMRARTATVGKSSLIKPFARTIEGFMVW